MAFYLPWNGVFRFFLLEAWCQASMGMEYKRLVSRRHSTGLPLGQLGSEDDGIQ